ncbi:MAG: hypothetical protein M3Y50_11860 [Acidobacteriota bacterium]|nr:hypothetical protein [Acidobacteriota bacterium]
MGHWAAASSVAASPIRRRASDGKPSFGLSATASTQLGNGCDGGRERCLVVGVGSVSASRFEAIGPASYAYGTKKKRTSLVAAGTGIEGNRLLPQAEDFGAIVPNMSDMLSYTMRIRWDVVALSADGGTGANASDLFTQPCCAHAAQRWLSIASARR